jgi:hemolysin III
MIERPQTRKEEIANTISHSFGILFCLIAMPFILIDAFNQKNTTPFYAVLVFAFGMLLVYTFSTIYHWVEEEGAKKRLKRWDHISIYFLIAGTYTPLMIKYLDNELAVLFLSTLWTLVGIGIIYKLFFMDRFEWFSVLLYLAMGWMIVFVVKPLFNTIPLSVFFWIVAGGLSYTIGVYFFVRSHKYFYHTIWHVFVLVGTIFHYVSIYMSV